ncbi:MAG: 4-(cytidine 5'-diphospho)-2-C-methyl-D-erythritol kinase [Nitrospirota bacterium]|nr:4-(cytidine 5'-diphospho)-2-C-methyl-D-erythritol kinase [Nitrospirota bacterium]MDH4359952.1 4-(cytidine 5'-diphospho)-2-C-methyl-D-erythritol kinase [Nitrospirota bacterium]
MSDAGVSAGEIVVRAPAKVNLLIRVLDRLPNGYHELWSLMHTVEVFDHLRIRLNPDRKGLSLVCGDAPLPVDKGNLVYRAADLVLQRAGKVSGVEIELTKVIPLSAGLGGGSSDAAATLYGLAHLLHLDWTLAEFCEAGAALGSDIPFFFRAPCAVVRGWGQEVIPCTLKGERWVVLVNPGFPIQTKWAYEQLASQRSTVLPLGEFPKRVDRQLNLSWEEVVEAMENDFEAPLFPVYPILGFIKEKLLSLGAQAALLSGSGATVFGIFHTQEEARQASNQLRRDTRWRIFDVPMGSTDLPHDPLSLPPLSRLQDLNPGI